MQPSSIQYKLLEVSSMEEFAPYINSFAQAFSTVFATPPYNEQFSVEDSISLVEFHLETSHRYTLLAVEGNKVIGFGLASSVRNYPEITRQIQGLLPPVRTHYFAELGVLPEYRQFGIGKKLIQSYFQWLQDKNFHNIVIRISDSLEAANKIFIDMGFEDMGVSMEISTQTTDGHIRSDKRKFLSRLVQK